MCPLGTTRRTRNADEREFTNDLTRGRFDRVTSYTAEMRHPIANAAVTMVRGRAARIAANASARANLGRRAWERVHGEAVPASDGGVGRAISRRSIAIRIRLRRLRAKRVWERIGLRHDAEWRRRSLSERPTPLHRAAEHPVILSPHPVERHCSIWSPLHRCVPLSHSSAPQPSAGIATQARHMRRMLRSQWRSACSLLRRGAKVLTPLCMNPANCTSRATRGDHRKSAGRWAR
jgi:hypothetical protein